MAGSRAPLVNLPRAQCTMQLSCKATALYMRVKISASEVMAACGSSWREICSRGQHLQSLALAPPRGVPGKKAASAQRCRSPPAAPVRPRGAPQEQESHCQPTKTPVVHTSSRAPCQHPLGHHPGSSCREPRTVVHGQSISEAAAWSAASQFDARGAADPSPQ